MSVEGLQQHQKDLIEGAMSVGALKFGSFTLKSGRYGYMRLNVLSSTKDNLLSSSPTFLAFHLTSSTQAYYAPVLSSPPSPQVTQHSSLNLTSISMYFSGLPTRAYPLLHQPHSYSTATTIVPSVTHSIVKKQKTTAKEDAWSVRTSAASACSSSTTS